MKRWVDRKPGQLERQRRHRDLRPVLQLERPQRHRDLHPVLRWERLLWQLQRQVRPQRHRALRPVLRLVLLLRLHLRRLFRLLHHHGRFATIRIGPAYRLRSSEQEP
jgi:hypothetical protein